MTTPATEDFVEASLRETAADLFAGGRRVDLPELLELGWEELIAAEPRAAVTALAEEQGRCLGSSRLLELVLGRGLDLDPGAEALAIPLGEASSDAGVDAIVLCGAAETASVVAIHLHDNGGHHLQRGSLDLHIETVEGIDPALGWIRIRGERRAADTSQIVDPELWDRAVGETSRALAHELVGVTSAMLDLAVDHARQREQFGVPIGSFQAVQHRLADVLVDLEATRAVLRTAWADDGSILCLAALASARRAFTTATSHCHQVLGAMGCTWEHPLHRYIRRGLALRLLLDPTPELAAAAHDLALTTHRTEVLA